MLRACPLDSESDAAMTEFGVSASREPERATQAEPYWTTMLTARLRGSAMLFPVGTLG